MPVLTDTLAEQISKLADEVHDANRLFGDFRVEVTRDLGAIRADMRELQATTRFSLKLAAWGIGILTPVVITLISFAFWAAFRAGEVNNRLSQLEQARAQAPAVPSPR